MNPKYSILMCNLVYKKYHTHISSWLSQGIKVIFFGSDSDVYQLKQHYDVFLNAYLLQVFTITSKQQGFILDGNVNPSPMYSLTGKNRDESLLTSLAYMCPSFNLAQYQVEHCSNNQHIIVQASAGTGKTTVMIDRILYLLHMDESLRMSDLHMITFTNEATNSMRTRLQKVLMTRYRLTKHARYLQMLEDQSQMNISTIHRFAFDMIREFGISQSFTRNLAIHDFEEEKQKLVKSIIEEFQDFKGIPLTRFITMISKYWNTIASQGISRSELSDMLWGHVSGGLQLLLQAILPQMVESLDHRYYDLKRKRDAIWINDIMRDLDDILTVQKLPASDLTMRYLFVDEFQDSDLSQVRVILQLVSLFGTRLFVVGDVKQSIYRFRGATDQAFVILEEQLLQMCQKGELSHFELINNYRTCANIMNEMHHMFQNWADLDLLKYTEAVRPLNRESGQFDLIHGNLDTQIEDQLIAQLVKEQLKLMERRVTELEMKGLSRKDTNRVVLLTRTNHELKLLQNILKKHHIPAIIRLDGSFYQSEAVRDFYTLIRSFLLDYEPIAIFDFLLTPYAGEIDSLDPNIMVEIQGDDTAIYGYLDYHLNQTNWKVYHKQFRLRPVLSVIYSILENEPVEECYEYRLWQRNEKAQDIQRKVRMHETQRDTKIQENQGKVRAHEIHEKVRMHETQRETKIQENQGKVRAHEIQRKVRQYRANLKHLIEILHRELGEEIVSLHRIYEFLHDQILNNTSESEPNIETNEDHSSVLCMTVHKSKGLEFDTIVIPFTRREFPESFQTEILIDHKTKEVGWNYQFGSTSKVRNNFYVKRKGIDISESRAEEVRILYVAMTRAIRNLVVVVHPSEDTETWGYLLSME